MTDTLTKAFDLLSDEVTASVPAPPAAVIQAAAARRRRTRHGLAAGSLAAAAGVVGLVLALPSGSSGNGDGVVFGDDPSGTSDPAAEAADGTYKELVMDRVREITNRPVIVPTTLPDGYAMLNPDDYYPLRPGLPGIRLCVLPSLTTPVIGSCVGTEDPSPWFTRDVGGQRIVVTTTSEPETAAALQPWRGLSYTAQWDTVSWLEQDVPS
jgi:hypothetical protein